MITGSPSQAVDTLWAEIEAAGPRPHAYLGNADRDSDEAVREEHARRRSFIAEFGYAVPTRQAITAIADFVERRKVIEACAGRGLWANLLFNAGIDVLATDAALPNGRLHHPVEIVEAVSAIRSNPYREVLLLCWPTLGNGAAADALDAFTGNRLVVIGDPRFIADAAFNEKISSDWEAVTKVPLPSWPGLDDRVSLGIRRWNPSRYTVPQGSGPRAADQSPWEESHGAR